MSDIDCLLETEEKYHMLSQSYNGYAFWIYHRRNIMWNLLRKKRGYDEAHDFGKVPFQKKLEYRLKMIYNAFFHAKVRVKKADVLFLNHERRVKNGDCYECIYTDEIAARLDTAVVLERPYMQTHMQPVNTKNLIYSDRIECFSTLYLYFHKYVIRCSYQKVKSQFRELITPIVTELSQRLGVQTDSKADIARYSEQMADGYFIYHNKKRHLKALVQRYSPELIMEVVSYNMDCMIVNEIAHDSKIPVVELQHGLMGPNHLAYNYPSGHFIRQFPDYFFAFSDYWCTEARFPIAGERLRAVGFAHLEQKCKSINKNPLLHKDNRKVIIFISQGPIGKKLSRIADELSKLADGNLFRIIYKLHPGEYSIWKERYPWLVESSVEVVDNNTVDLYEYFRISDYQVGAYGSTATFEGLYWGVKTFVWDEQIGLALQELWQKGYAQIFHTVEELYGMIVEDDNQKSSGEEFWKRDAISNIITQINTIIDNERNLQ